MKRTLLLTIHWVIILNFVIEIAYAGYMVFSVLRPDTGGGPLFEKALTMPFQQMTTRRLYAIECWIAMAGLAVYLGITEIGPRLREERNKQRV